MGLQSAISDDGKVVTIKVNGRFDFNAHQAFRDSYRNFNDPAVQYVIDLKDTEYMDSSALGMLMLLHRHVGERKNAIRIINAKPGIRRVLEIARFDKKFEIG